MLGGFKDRLEIPFGNVQKAIDNGIKLIEKTTEYMDDAQRLTRDITRVVAKVESLVEVEEKVKDLEAKRLEIEIELLLARKDKEIGAKKTKPKKKGGKSA